VVLMKAVKGFSLDLIGREVVVEGFDCKGILKFIGLHPEKQKPRLGVQLPSGAGGKHNGTCAGFKYFKSPKKTGVIVACSKVTLVEVVAEGGRGGGYGFPEDEGAGGLEVVVGKAAAAEEYDGFGGADEEQEEEGEVLSPLPSPKGGGGRSEADRKGSFFGFGRRNSNDKGQPEAGSGAAGGVVDTMRTKDLKAAMKAQAEFEKKREKEEKKAVAAAKKAHAKSRKTRGVELAGEAIKVPTQTGDRRLQTPLSAGPLDRLQKVLTRRTGARMLRHQPKKSAAVEMVMLDLPTYQIVMKSAKIKGDTYIALSEIREVRRGVGTLDTKGFALSTDYVKVQPELCFVILYGNQFVLHQLCYQAENAADFEAWTIGLEQHLAYANPSLYTSDLVLQRWMIATYRDTSLADGEPGVSLRDMKGIMRAFSVKTDNKTTKDLFDKISKGAAMFEYLGFTSMYHEYSTSTSLEEVFKECEGKQGNVDLKKMSAFCSKNGTVLSVVRGQHFGLKDAPLL
jgi:hypothetical protein